MVDIVTGVCGRSVQFLVEEEHHCVKEHVQIRFHSMEVPRVRDLQTKRQNATLTLVQVSTPFSIFHVSFAGKSIVLTKNTGIQ